MNEIELCADLSFQKRKKKSKTENKKLHHKKVFGSCY